MFFKPQKELITLNKKARTKRIVVVVVKSLHRENSLSRLSHRRPLRLHSLAQKEAGHLMNPTHEKTLS